MRKWIQSFLLCLWALAGFNACIMDIDKELPDCPPGAENPLAVTASLYCNGHRIDWPDSSRVGVIMLQGATDRFVYTPAAKPYFLTDAATSLFAPLSAKNAVGRPAAGESYTAIGVYPYALAVGEGLKAPFSIADQSDAAALDLLAAKRTDPVGNDTDTLHLDFYRQMSRLLFSLTLTEIDPEGGRRQADEQLAGATVEIEGMDVSAVFSWTDFLLSTSHPAAFQAKMQPDGRSGQVIVYPRARQSGVTFKVRLPQHPDTVYTFAMDPALELAACKGYTFSLPLEYRQKEGTNPPGPATQHAIRYRFEGEANSGNVTVFQGDLSTLWKTEETVYVDDHGQFSFAYDSRLTVSIRTDDGRTLALSPGTLYHFADITADLTIIISAATEKPVHRVNYVFEGEANASNVKLYKHGFYTPWPIDEYITVPHGDDFAWGYLSDLTVSVRDASGRVYTVHPDQLFTLTQITSDITLIISAETEPSSTVYHRITYEYNGELNRILVPVQGATEVSYPDWEPNQTLFVQHGGDFIFRYATDPAYTGAVTVTLNGKVMDGMTAGNDHPFHQITEDMHFILYDKKYHQVTVITNLTDQPATEAGTLVVEQDRFEYTLPAGATDVVVKVDGVVVTPTDGKYIIEHVTKDTVILLTNDKGGREPDLIIKADVHDWEELPVIDGGVITPDKN